MEGNQGGSQAPNAQLSNARALVEPGEENGGQVVVREGHQDLVLGYMEKLDNYIKLQLHHSSETRNLVDAVSSRQNHQQQQFNRHLDFFEEEKAARAEAIRHLQEDNQALKKELGTIKQLLQAQGFGSAKPEQHQASPAAKRRRMSRNSIPADAASASAGTATATTAVASPDPSPAAPGKRLAADGGGAGQPKRKRGRPTKAAAAAAAAAAATAAAVDAAGCQRPARAADARPRRVSSRGLHLPAALMEARAGSSAPAMVQQEGERTEQLGGAQEPGQQHGKQLQLRQHKEVQPGEPPKEQQERQLRLRKTVPQKLSKHVARVDEVHASRVAAAPAVLPAASSAGHAGAAGHREYFHQEEGGPRVPFPWGMETEALLELCQTFQHVPNRNAISWSEAAIAARTGLSNRFWRNPHLLPIYDKGDSHRHITAGLVRRAVRERAVRHPIPRALLDKFPHAAKVASGELRDAAAPQDAGAPPAAAPASLAAGTAAGVAAGAGAPTAPTPSAADGVEEQAAQTAPAAAAASRRHAVGVAPAARAPAAARLGWAAAALRRSAPAKQNAEQGLAGGWAAAMFRRSAIPPGSAGSSVTSDGAAPAAPGEAAEPAFLQASGALGASDATAHEPGGAVPAEAAVLDVPAATMAPVGPAQRGPEAGPEQSCPCPKKSPASLAQAPAINRRLEDEGQGHRVQGLPPLPPRERFPSWEGLLMRRKGRQQCKAQPPPLPGAQPRFAAPRRIAGVALASEGGALAATVESVPAVGAAGNGSSTGGAAAEAAATDGGVAAVGGSGPGTPTSQPPLAQLLGQEGHPSPEH